MKIDDAFRKYLEAAIDHRLRSIIEKLEEEVQKIKTNPPDDINKIDHEINKFETIKRFVEQVMGN